MKHQKCTLFYMSNIPKRLLHVVLIAIYNNKLAGLRPATQAPRAPTFVTPAAGPLDQREGRGARARVGRMGDRVV